MTDLLVAQPLLLLFLVLALGFALGRVSVGGVSLGVAAVLFVGLAAGALEPRLELPELFSRFGLVLFVYAVGIGSGPGFWASFRRRGGRDALWVTALLGAAFAIVHLVRPLLEVSSPVAAGLFCGALTNTPALAGVLERLPPGHPGPIVGYSVAYPMGALGIVLALAVARRLWGRELDEARQMGRLEMRFVKVTRERAAGRSAEALLRETGIRARLVRLRRRGAWSLLPPSEALALDDLVTAVGMPQALDALVAELGEVSSEGVSLEASGLEHRRIFVSERHAVGRPLAELRTLSRFGALVTRVRRGDLDLAPDGRTVLELGDRVRAVAPRARMEEVSRFFGDSYRAISEIDVVSFGLGAALGLLLGMVEVPLPFGGEFRLGPAGGPLVMGLVLGGLGRSGPILWQLPYSASVTLRQVGVSVFLAGVGVRAGTPFLETLRAGGGPELLALGAGVTLTTATLALVTARLALRAPAGMAMGMAAGVHTQPAALAFANDAARDASPDAGYSSVGPIATVAKIVLAQLLLGLTAH